jgi:hypothetical protein
VYWLVLTKMHLSLSQIGLTREELQCIKNLTDENLKLKRMLKAKEKDLTQKTLDMEVVSNQHLNISVSSLLKALCSIEKAERDLTVLDYAEDVLPT